MDVVMKKIIIASLIIYASLFTTSCTTKTTNYDGEVVYVNAPDTLYSTRVDYLGYGLGGHGLGGNSMGGYGLSGYGGDWRTL